LLGILCARLAEVVNTLAAPSELGVVGMRGWRAQGRLSPGYRAALEGRYLADRVQPVEVQPETSCHQLPIRAIAGRRSTFFSTVK
jgi:hypothetical protein